MIRRFRVSFWGRKAGALGRKGFCVFDVTAEDAEAARLEAYKTHEHIENFAARQLPSLNDEGLSFKDWLNAAGFPAGKPMPQKLADIGGLDGARDAWAANEDPTEYRA